MDTEKTPHAGHCSFEELLAVSGQPYLPLSRGLGPNIHFTQVSWEPADRGDLQVLSVWFVPVGWK